MWIFTGFRKLRERTREKDILAEHSGETVFAHERMQKAQTRAKERFMLADASPEPEARTSS